MFLFYVSICLSFFFNLEYQEEEEDSSKKFVGKQSTEIAELTQKSAAIYISWLDQHQIQSILEIISH